MSKITLVFVLYSFCAIAIDAKTDLDQAFKENQVVPDVFAKAPNKKLEISYKASEKQVELGNELKPKEVRETPEVKYDAEEGEYYSLVMADPDAPSRAKPASREWLHWLVGNIPGSKVNEGEAIAAYVGSGPPKGTGLHRYVFLLFKQPGKIEFDEPTHTNTDGNRGKFSTKKFAEKYHLGNPVAGNFYEAQFDDSVPDLHRQLGF